MKDFALPSHQGSTPSCSRPVLMAPLHDSSDGQQLGYYSSDGQGLWYLEVRGQVVHLPLWPRPVFRGQCRSRFCHSSLPTSVFFFIPRQIKTRQSLDAQSAICPSRRTREEWERRAWKLGRQPYLTKVRKVHGMAQANSCGGLFLSDLRKRGESADQ